MAFSVLGTVEPQPGAPVDAWRSWIRDLIRAGQFTSRFWSWVYVSDRYFLKVPRVSGRLEADFSNAAAEADREYRLTQSLAEGLEGMIDVPLRLVDGCIVKPRLTGPDLWAIAKEEGATPRVHRAISHGITLTAHLHRLDPAVVGDLAAHDYANDPYLPAPESLHDRLNKRPRTIVLPGLEVRNFKQDRADGRWLFFDPDKAVLGAPEDDFTRYILSLLMINWGRHANCCIWTQFDYHELARIYQAERGAALDHELLVYMFQRNIGRRRYEVRNTTRDLPWLMQVAARSYEQVFFWQVRRWGGRHGL